MESTRIDFKVFPLLIMEHIDAAHVLADADAAAAEDAAVHVVQDQRVGVIGGKALCTHLEASGLRSDILDQHLQFAVAVLGAGGAVFRVPGEQQLEGQLVFDDAAAEEPVELEPDAIPADDATQLFHITTD